MTTNDDNEAWDKFVSTGWGKRFLEEMDAAFEVDESEVDEFEPDEDVNRGER